MIGLPLHYESPLHLPFNHTCLEQSFVLQTPDQDPGGPGCWLALQGHRLVVSTSGATLALPMVDLSEKAIDQPVYLGLWRGQPCRLLALDREETLPKDCASFSFTEENPLLPIELLTLGGLGRMVLHWLEGRRHCSACGSTMQPLPGEWGMNCPRCESHHFPHIHPCAIVLVRRPGEVLLTRKPQWAPNRYSLVAGFVEFGECLEEAAAREIREETGIEVTNVRYVGSQCWPFPSQLMCGFLADYAGGEVKVDEAELADARWFRTDQLPALPPKRSIARYILDTALGLQG